MKPNVFIFVNFRLFLYLLFWILSILFHNKLSYETYKIGMEIDLIKKEPLYDIIQVKVPNLQPYRYIPEVLHVVPVIGLIGFIAHYRNKNSLDALCHFLSNHAILMLLRSIFFSSTLLPDSSKMCAVSTHIGSCFDLIFSGHTTIMYLCTFIINQYFYISRTVYFLFHLNNFITSLLIISCRNHYTIDVLISVILTYLVFYHRKNDNDKFDKKYILIKE